MKTSIGTQKEHNRIKDILGVNFIKTLKANGAILAGGAITSMFSGAPISDWDLYFPDTNSLENVEKWMKLAGYNRLFYSKATRTYQGDNMSVNVERNDRSSIPDYGYYYGKQNEEDIIIQLVDPTMMKGVEEEILEVFDFSICQATYNFKTEEFKFGDSFFNDLLKKELRFNINALHPICSFLRTKKYCDRGFTLPDEELLKIIMVMAKAIPTMKYIDVVTQFNMSGIADPNVVGHLFNSITLPQDSDTNDKNSIENELIDVDEVLNILEDMRINGVYIPDTVKNLPAKGQIVYECKTLGSSYIFDNSSGLPPIKEDEDIS